MGIFGRFSRDRPRPEPRSPTGQGDPHNRRRSMGFNPTGPSSELQPAPGPHPHHRAPSAPSAAPSDDGTAELPLEDHQQAPEPYAGFSEPGTPPTSRKGSTALLNSQGSMYRQQNSVPPANGTSGMSSSLSPGTLALSTSAQPGAVLLKQIHNRSSPISALRPVLLLATAQNQPQHSLLAWQQAAPILALKLMCPRRRADHPEAGWHAL